MLTDRHYLVLACLGRQDSADAIAIAAELGLEADEVLALLDDLADAGLVALPGMEN